MELPEIPALPCTGPEGEMFAKVRRAVEAATERGSERVTLRTDEVFYALRYAANHSEQEGGGA